MLTAETSEQLLGGGRRYHRMGLRGGDRRPRGAGCGRRGTALALADGDRLEAVLAQDRVGETEFSLEIRADAGPDLVTLDQGLHELAAGDARLAAQVLALGLQGASLEKQRFESLEVLRDVRHIREARLDVGEQHVPAGGPLGG